MSTALRRMAGEVYRRAVAPLGRRAVRRAERNGLPAELAPALRGLFGCERGDGAERVARRIEALRRELAARDTDYQISQGTRRTAGWIAGRSSVGPRWGMFLHRCAAGVGARRILELGSCAGISGCYLATAPSCRTFLTLEGSAELAALARTHLGRIAPHARLMQSTFDEGLDAALADVAPVDLVYIDGDHQRDATLRYVDAIRPHMAERAIMLLDDIRWSPGMFAAWREIAARDEVTCAVDTGRIGVCELGGPMRAGPFDVSRWMGWLRVERR